jgi:hypothetical protein
MALYQPLPNVLVGDTAADLPAPNRNPADEPGTIFLTRDNSIQRSLQPDGLGALMWGPYNAGAGGGVTINTTEPVQGGGGPAVVFALQFGFTGQHAGDLAVCTGLTWVRLPTQPLGPNGNQLWDLGAGPVWFDAVHVTGTLGQAIDVTGGPAYTLALKIGGQQAGDLIYRNAANTQWQRLPVAADGFVLTLAGGLPTWAPAGGGGITVVAGDGTSVSAGPNYQVNVSVPGEADGDLIVRTAGAWARLPVGIPGQLLGIVGAQPTWVAGGGPGTLPVSAVDVYVKPAASGGSDLNDGLNAALPAATIGHVIDTLAINGALYTQQCIIHLLSSGGNPIVETKVWAFDLPSPVGGGAAQVTITGTDTVVVPGAIAGAASTQGGGAVFGTYDFAAAMVPGTHKGAILWVTNDPPNNGLWRIVDNDALGVVTIVGAFNAPPAVGVAISSIIRPDNTIQLVTGQNTIRSGSLTLTLCSLDLGGGSLDLRGPCATQASDVGNGSIQVTATGTLEAFGGPWSGDAFWGSNPHAGLWVRTGTNVNVNGAFASGGGVLTQGGWTCVRSTLFIEGIAMEGGGFLQLVNTWGLLQAFRAANVIVPPGQFGAIEVDASSELVGLAGDVSNTGGGALPGIAVVGQSLAFLQGVTGAGNGGAGVRVGLQSTVFAPDAGIGTTITGVGGDVRIGGNAAATTWAAILGATVVNDLAALKSQFCIGCTAF